MWLKKVLKDLDMKYIIAVFLLSTSLAQAQFMKNTGIQLVNTGNLTVNGDWVNDSGTVIKNDGVITTSDSWTNNGTLAITSTGGFVLNFASDKTFTPGGTNFGFLQKEGIGNANIAGQFSVKDSLNIKGGLIKPLTTTDILTVSATGTVTSVPGSFLEGGNLVRQGTGNLFFPVGKGGKSLPITFLNVTGANPSVSVTIEDAPTGYTAGAGINALIDFPYVWKTTKVNVSDSASYVEIEYPNTLPTATDVVVVKKLTGQNRYEGIGARQVTTTANTVKVRSYSRALQGTFSIARGFKGNLKTDSLALVSLYKSTDGTAWTNKTNWTTGKVNTWQGVTETGGQITSIALANNKVRGALPAEFLDMAALQTINLSGNDITVLPDLTSLTGITTLNVSNNKLDFASLEPNKGITGINFSNQKELGIPVDELVAAGTGFTLKVPVGGTANQYQWKRNNTSVSGATSNQYEITSIGRANSGTYTLEISNTLVPGVTLRSSPQKVTAVADLSGKLSIDANTPVAKGKMTLLKIKPVGLGYDTTRIQDLKPDGTYSMPKVVLDDYILLGQADTITYKGFFPTYYNGSVFWEEADTIRLNANRNDLSYAVAALPAVKPKGVGELRGTFENEIAGGRVEGRGRVSGASVTVRRQQNAGRPSRKMAEDEIVAFLYTNDEGRFVFEELEEGFYLLNIQYPGVPMDTKSNLVTTIGPASRKQNIQEVTALAIGGKIEVKRKVIVGVSEEVQATVQIYPNPVSTDLYIDLLKGSGVGEMKMFDGSGKEILSQHLKEGKSTFDLSTLSSGIYILKIYRGNTEVSAARIAVH
jgi:hypothetical protein